METTAVSDCQATDWAKERVSIMAGVSWARKRLHPAARRERAVGKGNRCERGQARGSPVCGDPGGGGAPALGEGVSRERFFLVGNHPACYAVP